MSAREEVLARIRSALGPDGGHRVEVPRDYQTAGDHPPGDAALVELFAERVADYRAEVWRATSDELGATIAQAFTDGLARSASPPSNDAAVRVVVPTGLPDAWMASVTADLVTDDGQLDVATLDACAGVITGAAIAIAETGTIVLDASDDQGRRAITLVPDLHVCVVRSGQVVASVPEAVARLDPTRPLTWISGPSATSDIELDRVEGVHGPRTLEVVIVED